MRAHLVIGPDTRRKLARLIQEVERKNPDADIELRADANGMVIDCPGVITEPLKAERIEWVRR